MNIDKYKKTRRRGADRRWTLLFIGDHGKQFTIKRFKVIIATAGCVFLMVLASLAILFWGHQKSLAENQDLQRRLQNSQQQIETLRHEKEILMARLVVAESQAQESRDNQTPEENPIATKTAGNVVPPASVPKPVPKPEKKPSVAAVRPIPAAEPQAKETEAVMKVAVDNFKVSRDAGNGTVTAQFKIRNTSSGNLRADGVAVVILKGADLTIYQWLVMPMVDLIGNKPTGKRGKRFVIKRFRTMEFTSPAPKHADRFRLAEVYVFSKTGQQLLEREFAIKLPPLPVVAVESPDAAPPPPKAKPAAAPSQPTSSEPKSAQETPAIPSAPSEAPTEDDVLEELENAPPVF